LKIYNTLTKEKEELVPNKPGEISIYACGPTVYNFFHIGNARPFIIFDTLRRYLEFCGYKVTFVQNFTDVDDKMINRAREEGVSIKELGEKYIKEYFKDAKGLNILPADVHPKATEHIGDIIKFISGLIEKGMAYEVDGDVYFRVSKFKEYGKLSGQSLDELMMGARIDVDKAKENPMDFALWKKKKQPDEIAWKSPWGEGRPGWHIECSAMSMKYLGETFDIHGGGQDLIFPHHENEIAQSEGLTGKPYVKYWMHNGYINIDNKKMSKSENNFFTVRDISKEFDLITVRFFMLSAHYRSPVDFSKDMITNAKTALLRIENCRENLEHIIKNGDDKKLDIKDVLKKYVSSFKEAMDDDLNTAEAIGQIFEMVKELNLIFAESSSAPAAKEAIETLDKLLDVLGILRKKEEIPEEIIDMAKKRQQARKQKDYVLSDKLRDQIAEKGYEIKDTVDGFKITKID